MPKGRGSGAKVKGRTELTDKEKVFVEVYLQTNNMTEAVRRAYSIRPGSPANNVSAFGAKVARRPLVKAAIDRAVERTRAKFELKADKVIGEAAAIAFADIGEVADWDEDGLRVKASKDLTRAQRALISEVIQTTDKNGNRHVRVKLHSKLQAIELLGKNLKLWNDTSVNLLVANLTALPDDQLMRRVQELSARAAGGALPAPAPPVLEAEFRPAGAVGPDAGPVEAPKAAEALGGEKIGPGGAVSEPGGDADEGLDEGPDETDEGTEPIDGNRSPQPARDDRADPPVRGAEGAAAADHDP